ncbi:uncharacterized protein DUF3592 [Haloactinospora alba]|uniref:Uncharacterized protein DUF3592 n=1 Tax=Haloactinospora alba TaxID=405555 RepID=A0A543N715_9ACTN|nr:DUF3592 domain-containing protein [Haloactinospora alba]TQN27622.1 uncharacterized protein DUF3592 [Haloactinospora alba]
MDGETTKELFGWLVMTAFGAGFAGFGGWYLRRLVWLRRNGLRVPGRVGGRNWSLTVDTDGPTSVSARSSSRYRFRTAEGEEVSAAQRFAFSHNMLREGQHVTVAYNPANPRESEIVEAKSQVISALLFLLLGGLFLVIGLLLVAATLTP